MLSPALVICAKDLRLVLGRGTGLLQALLLGLLLVFVFSLSQEPGEVLKPQAAAAIFWLASVFCQVLIFNMLYALEESSGQRLGLLLAPVPAQAVWLGKALAGALLILAAQALFVPSIVVFLGQGVSSFWGWGLLCLVLVDFGLAALGSLLGALAQGQAARESLLSIVLFPLLIPVLLAGISAGAAVFGAEASDGALSWLGVVLAFDAMFIAAALLLFGFVYSADE